MTMHHRAPFAVLVVLSLLLRGTAPFPTLAQGIGCELFVAREDAQAVFEANRADRANMDPDGDGIACEEKPTRRDNRQRTTDGPTPAPPATIAPTPATAPTATRAPTSPPTPSPTPVPTTDAVAEALDADIDTFWRRTFESDGLIYQSPSGVVPIEDWSGRTIACSPMPERGEYAAFYCAGDQSIYYDPEIRSRTLREWGDPGWAMLMAHEWGHHVLFLLGLNSNSQSIDIEEELLANCLAGVYVNDAEARGWMSTEEAAKARKIASTSQESVSATHGTSEQRGDAFDEGYEGGLPGCGIDL